MKSLSKYSFCVLFATLSILLVGCFESQHNADQTSQEAPICQIDAKVLYDEYESNQVAADQKYKGKVIVVTGSIKDIGKDLMDQPYIKIGRSAVLGVDCTFVKKDSSPIANLQKGQTVSVKGRVEGKIINVKITECSLQ